MRARPPRPLKPGCGTAYWGSFPGGPDRREAELSLADCLLVASARTDDEIATSDPVIAAVARAEKIAVRALPDSDGNVP